MSNRKPKRNNIKICPSLLTDKNKIDKFTWEVKQGNKLFQVTLHPTKGYSIQDVTWKRKSRALANQ